MDGEPPVISPRHPPRPREFNRPSSDRSRTANVFAIAQIILWVAYGVYALLCGWWFWSMLEEKGSAIQQAAAGAVSAAALVIGYGVARAGDKVLSALGGIAARSTRAS